MTDIWNKEKRSEVMSKIHSENTRPELILRKALFARGFRYRVNDKRLPGKPDIVLPKYKTIIFIHGCFWHGHDDCKYAYTPKSNIEFWVNKITSNAKRDKVNIEKLTALGWNVITVWECEITHKYKHDLTPLVDKVSVTILENRLKKFSMKIYEERENTVMLVAEDIVKYQRTPSLKSNEET